MSERMREQSRRLLESVLGMQVQPLDTFAQVVEALGQGELLLTFQWAGGSHQLVAKEIDGERVYLYNPAPLAGNAPGTILGGQNGVPERRSEGGGIESMELAVLQELLETGAVAADRIAG